MNAFQIFSLVVFLVAVVLLVFQVYYRKYHSGCLECDAERYTARSQDKVIVEDEDSESDVSDDEDEIENDDHDAYGA